MQSIRLFLNETRIPTPLLEQALRLILQEKSFEINRKNYLQTHGTAMGTKMVISFLNISMVKDETDILSQRETTLPVWKRFIDDIFSLWNVNSQEIRS